jgi:hypothetical protein
MLLSLNSCENAFAYESRNALSPNGRWVMTV